MLVVPPARVPRSFMPRAADHSKACDCKGGPLVKVVWPTIWLLSLMSRAAVKMLFGRLPKFPIFLFVQLVALTFPLLMKESPAITPAEFISNAQLEFPPDKVPRLVMPPPGVQRKAKKSDAELALTLE